MGGACCRSQAGAAACSWAIVKAAPWPSGPAGPPGGSLCARIPPLGSCSSGLRRPWGGASASWQLEAGAVRTAGGPWSGRSCMPAWLHLHWKRLPAQICHRLGAAGRRAPVRWRPPCGNLKLARRSFFTNRPLDDLHNTPRRSCGVVTHGATHLGPPGAPQRHYRSGLLPDGERREARAGSVALSSASQRCSAARCCGPVQICELAGLRRRLPCEDLREWD